VWNFNLLTRLIGIQRFEKKGANPGGGGGLDPGMRSLFKFVSYWNPSLVADAEGRATFELELPDNLTAWRVLVMGSTAHDRLGLGQATFRVNRPTEIRPALPNRVIEGDRFDARFTVMNRTEHARTLRIDLVQDLTTGQGFIFQPTGTPAFDVDGQPFADSFSGFVGGEGLLGVAIALVAVAQARRPEGIGTDWLGNDIVAMGVGAIAFAALIAWFVRSVRR